MLRRCLGSTPSLLNPAVSDGDGACGVGAAKPIPCWGVESPTFHPAAAVKPLIVPMMVSFSTHPARAASPHSRSLSIFQQRHPVQFVERCSLVASIHPVIQSISIEQRPVLIMAEATTPGVIRLGDIVPNFKVSPKNALHHAPIAFHANLCSTGSHSAR